MKLCWLNLSLVTSQSSSVTKPKVAAKSVAGGRDRLGLADGSRRRSVGVLQCKADPVFVILRNVAGQWNQVFVQPLPEEEVTVRHDQDPRVSWI